MTLRPRGFSSRARNRILRCTSAFSECAYGNRPQSYGNRGISGTRSPLGAALTGCRADARWPGRSGATAGRPGKVVGRLMKTREVFVGLALQPVALVIVDADLSPPSSMSPPRFRSEFGYISTPASTGSGGRRDATPSRARAKEPQHSGRGCLVSPWVTNQFTFTYPGRSLLWSSEPQGRCGPSHPDGRQP
jgi:hypothetical protein